MAVPFPMETVLRLLVVIALGFANGYFMMYCLSEILRDDDEF